MLEARRRLLEKAVAALSDEGLSRLQEAREQHKGSQAADLLQRCAEAGVGALGGGQQAASDMGRAFAYHEAPW